MEQNNDLFSLHLDSDSTIFLRETAKWSRFLAIVGFVICGLIILASLFAGTLMSSIMAPMAMGGGMGDFPAASGAVLVILYAIIAAIYFIPCLYMYKFATKMTRAIQINDQHELIASFSNLKSAFKFMGILTIVILAFYGLALLMVLMGVALAS